MHHSKMLNNREIFWEVDINAAIKVQKWVQKFPQIFNRELDEMKTHFPRWILTVTDSDGKLKNCPQCNNTLVLTQGKIVCINCQSILKKFNNLHLAWTGLIPTPISGRENLQTRLNKINEQPFPVVELDNIYYLLTPVVVMYTNKFPVEEPYCYYTSEFMKVLGTPKNGSYIHLLSGNRMCLFGYGEWNSLSVRQVIQQRVLNHLISTIKIADGMPAHKAFIGKGH